MVVEGESGAVVYGHKYSTVVPGTVTGENVVHEFTNTDLVMKLHYLKTVYYFKHSDVIDGLTIIKLKEPMFSLLDEYFVAAGRIRRTESGRPTIKCNDSGGRIVEAKCGRTLDEWLELGDSSGWKHLVPDKVIGPDLQFSPTVYIQFTKFKCGGMSIGLSWSHILGDAMSATNFMNMWGQLLKSNPPPTSIQPRNKKRQNEEQQTIDSPKPLSVKQIESVGDCWLLPADVKMLTPCLQVTEARIKKMLQGADRIPNFEMISAVIWHSLAKVRTGKEPKLVTICRYDPSAKSRPLSNEQKISIVNSTISPTDYGLPELAMLIIKQDVEESTAVEELKDNDQQDFAFYGTNLTFVDMKGIDLHGLDLKGQKPIKVDHAIAGIGNKGTVLVFNDSKGADANGGDAVIPVMLILPEDEIMPLRELLKSQYGLT